MRNAGEVMESIALDRWFRNGMQAAGDHNIFLSTMPATRRGPPARAGRRRRLLVLFACAVPFAGMPLAPVPAFVASYQSALAINDLITAVLLFSQFVDPAFVGAAAAGERLSVHRRRGDRARPDLSRPVLRRPDCSTAARRPRSGST